MIILIMITIFIGLYLIHNLTKLKCLITRLALYQLQPKNQIVDALAPEKSQNSVDIICTRKLEWLTILMLSISMQGVITFLYMKAMKVRIYKGYLYSSASCLMLFVSGIFRYAPIQISHVSGDIN